MGDAALCVKNHLVELNRKKEKLEKQIKQLERSPAGVHLEVRNLKKQKLSIKDEMERLQNPNRMTAVDLPAKTLANLEDNPKPLVELSSLSKVIDENQLAA